MSYYTLHNLAPFSLPFEKNFLWEDSRIKGWNCFFPTLILISFCINKAQAEKNIEVEIHSFSQVCFWCSSILLTHFYLVQISFHLSFQCPIFISIYASKPPREILKCKEKHKMLRNDNSIQICGRNPSSIYSCSIGHSLEHKFCHLGCWAVLWKISETTKILLKYATFEGVFLNFLRAKKN